MRQWIDLFETKHYVGSCVNSFDDDGDCVIGDLPWSSVSDLGYADENAKKFDKRSFTAMVNIPSDVLEMTAAHEVEYLEHDGVYMIYDMDDDIHYFFV